MADNTTSDARGSPAQRASSPKPTAFDVAELAGVSQPTVSRALRDRAGVNTETRKRILDAARQLGYRPDQRAVSLRGGSTGRIAVVILTSGAVATGDSNPLYMSLVANIVSAAAHRGYEILLSVQGSSKELYADYARDKVADGVIVMGSAKNSSGWAFFARAFEAGGRIISWGSPNDRLPALRCDNEAAAKIAVGHLISGGRTNIAFVGPDWRRQRAHADRRTGYRVAVTAFGSKPIEAPTVGGLDREEQGYLSTRALLTTQLKVDALFAASDLLAIGALRALRELDRSCPDEIAVIGFDGIAATELVHPTLSTITQDLSEAGRLLVDIVLQPVGPSLCCLPFVPMHLKLRESSRAQRL